MRENEHIAPPYPCYGMGGGSAMEAKAQEDWEKRYVNLKSASAMAYRIEELESFIARRGYRRCDIAACNCGSFHGGHAEERLREIYDALGMLIQGKTALQAVRELVALNDKMNDTKGVSGCGGGI